MAYVLENFCLKTPVRYTFTNIVKLSYFVMNIEFQGLLLFQRLHFVRNTDISQKKKKVPYCILKSQHTMIFKSCKAVQLHENNGI